MGHITNANAYIRLGFPKNGFVMGRKSKGYLRYLHEDFLILDL